MKTVDLIKIGSPLLKEISKYGLKQNDYRYIGLYADYQHLRIEQNEKYEAVICELAIKYKISESTVKRIIRRFSQTIK